MILSICSDPKILEVMRYINIFILIIKIVVPIILILSLMIKFATAVTSGGEDGLKKVMKSAPSNVIAAVVIFLVPTLVSLLVSISFPNADYKNCLTVRTKEQINEIYISKMEALLSTAELTENYNDYLNASNYLSNIKDENKKQEYKDRLDALLAKIDETRQMASGANNYASVNYDNWQWTYYGAKSGPNAKYYSDTNPYAIWAPKSKSNLSGVSLPLIIWLHGMGETASKMPGSSFLERGLMPVVKNWKNYGLDSIPAIIVAPQSYKDNWNESENRQTIRALVKYAAEEYNIDTSKIVLMGHSMGGYGTVALSWTLKDINFAACVVMSAPGASSNDDRKEYYSSLKIRGYGEVAEGKNFFEWMGKSNYFTHYPGVAHMDVIEKAFTEDSNKDGVSDLVFWLFGKNTYSKSDNNYALVDYSNWNWTYYGINSGPVANYYSKSMPYAVWAPKDVSSLNGVSLPLIIWLHGRDEYYPNKTGNSFISTGIMPVVKDWKNYGLDNIPAIIFAPQTYEGDWCRSVNYETVKAIINYAHDYYNINTNKVILMGHSMGGNGVLCVSYNVQQFEKLVVMSTSRAAYSTKPNEGLEYFSSIPIRGYGENSATEQFMKWAGQEQNFTSCQMDHMAVPKYALTLDKEDPKGVSDLVYWMFGQNGGKSKK